MKNTVFVILGAILAVGLLAACSSAPVDNSEDVIAVAGQRDPINTGKIRFKDPDLLQKYVQTVEASRSCKTHQDCVQIDKGCCLCDGKQAVHKKHVEKLDKQREEACGIGPCTMQMCYTDLNVKCEKNKCVGVLKDPAPFQIR